MRVVDDAKCTYAKCILVTCIYVFVCLSVAACAQYGTDLDVTWGNGRGWPLTVHYGWICNQCMGFVATTTYHHHNHFTALFPGPPG